MDRVSYEWIAACLADEHFAGTAHGEAVAELQRWRRVEAVLRQRCEGDYGEFAAEALRLIDQPRPGE